MDGKYEGDLIPQFDRRDTDRVQEWPTLPELYRTMNELSRKVDDLNGKLSNGLPAKVSAIEKKVDAMYTTQMQCVWGRAGAWRFLTGVFAVAGGITVIMNLVGRFAGWW